jgi:hypothetical protein
MSATQQPDLFGTGVPALRESFSGGVPSSHLVG